MTPHRSPLVPALMVATLASSVFGVPTVWESRGVGGGGALFSPTFNPHDPNGLTVATDMSALFRSTNLGASWETVNFLEIQGNRATKVQYTEDPLVQYAVDFTVVDGNDLMRPTRSNDGGVTWTPLGGDPTDGGVYTLLADPANHQRLIVASYDTVYFSNNGGSSFAQRFNFANGGNGIHVGGAFWDGANIYVGTNAGLLVSANGGTSFALSGVTGIPGTQEIVSFTGAKEGGTVRLFATTTGEDLYGGIAIEDMFWTHQDVWTLDVGNPSWTLRTTGLPTDASDGLALISCAQNDIDVCYVSGQRGSIGELPMIFKTTNGGASWNSVFNYVDNQNVTTGWAGEGGDRGWYFDGGPVGFSVAGNDANRIAFTGYGFMHISTNGGTSWRQVYVNPTDENPPGSDIVPKQAYRGVGLEDTAIWNLAWFDADHLWANTTDIQGIRSTDGGASWGFSYTGHSQNTSYQVVVHPTTNVGYMAASTIHDIYQTTYLTDARLDGGDGQVNFSTDKGATWQLLHDFNNPVVDLALDPTSATRMFASVVDSTTGGVYVSNSINLGSASTWTKLANPPRTEGHPFVLRVLNDGTIVATYSGRRAGNAFTDGSGVFVSTNGGGSWNDRSDVNMHYYVKDIVIDPHDTSQNTWYVGVWSGYGGPLATNNEAGGLYRTTNRGSSWTRVWESHRVSSIAIHPDAARSGEAYITTEAEGLWHTANLNDATPTFDQITSYPFREPKRVVFNPFNPAEVWVVNFGNAMRVGVDAITPPSSVDGWVLF